MGAPYLNDMSHLSEHKIRAMAMTECNFTDRHMAICMTAISSATTDINT